MKYAFKKSESVTENIRRIILGQQKNAIRFLSKSNIEPDTAIHESRKCFKRIRAVFRMIRYEIGPHSFKMENECYRDAGRLISGMRDSAVCISTLTGLYEEFPGMIEAEHFGELKVRFEKNYEATFDRIVNKEKAMEKAADIIRAAKRRTPQLKLEREDFGVILKGVRRVYMSGNNLFINSQYESTPYMFHEWRKSAKNLWYHMTLLKPVNPAVLKKLTAGLDELSDLLGIDHDLFRLELALVKLPEVSGNRKLFEALFESIKIKSFNNRADAWKLAAEIYNKKPARFAGELENYLDCWINPG